MGLINALKGAIGGTMADQWLEFFYCDALDDNTLVSKGVNRLSKKRFSSNTKGEDNIISRGSKIAVNEGQCMIIVDQGAIVELCAEPGEFIYDSSTEPSLLHGNLGKNILDTLGNIASRVTYGGGPGRDQRVYFVKTNKVHNNKYGTATPIPFRIVDESINFDMDVSIRCNGEYVYKIINPVLFYKEVSANVVDTYTKDNIEGQLKADLMTKLQPAFAEMAKMGIRYSEIHLNTMELANILKKLLTETWTETYGIEIDSFGINTISLSKEDEEMLKELQKMKSYINPAYANAALNKAKADALVAGASNTSTGAMMGLAAMNMAGAAGSNMGGATGFFGGGQPQAPYGQPQAPYGQPQAPYGQPQAPYGQPQAPYGQPEQAPAPAPVAVSAAIAGWACKCGHSDNTGKFCAECGLLKPDEVAGWTCTCGVINKGKFCAECGAKKPAGELLYKCDKCGWEPTDHKNPPKFCPECGDTFDENDILS